jgi:hypothetical protein
MREMQAYTTESLLTGAWMGRQLDGRFPMLSDFLLKGSANFVHV